MNFKIMEQNECGYFAAQFLLPDSDECSFLAQQMPEDEESRRM